MTKLPRARKEKKLPSILSKEDVVKIIESVATYKQQVLLSFIYVTGARLSETINVKIEDIDSHRMQVRINQGSARWIEILRVKGNKDRFIIVPQILINLLRDYYRREKPEIYLFNAKVKGQPYNPRSVQLAMQQAKKIAKITKIGSIHTLRNCYATHHLESGTDLLYLQDICASYKAIFIKELRSLYRSGKITYHNDFEVLISEVQKIRWVVHSTRPTMDTKVIVDYLAKYIHPVGCVSYGVNRIAISNKRLDYIKDSEKVIILHNDYKNQQSGQPAPKAYKIMDSLVAIDQILQHVLPPYFQKSRRYGIHHSSSKLKATIPDAVKRNSQTIRTVFEIITELMKLQPYKCEKCGSDNHQIEEIKPDKTWILSYINPNPRPPPDTKVLVKSQPI